MDPLNRLDHAPATPPLARRLPSPAALAAVVVAVLGAAAIILTATGLHRSVASATPSTTVTADVPIQMLTVHDVAAASVNADGSVQLHGQSGPVLSIVFTADEAMMAGTDRAGNAHVWSRDGRLLATVTPASGLRISSVSFTPKGQQFVTVSSDGSVHFWPLPSGS
jgi:WD40 repeat protein